MAHLEIVQLTKEGNRVFAYLANDGNRNISYSWDRNEVLDLLKPLGLNECNSDLYKKINGDFVLAVPFYEPIQKKNDIDGITYILQYVEKEWDIFKGNCVYRAELANTKGVNALNIEYAVVSKDRCLIQKPNNFGDVSGERWLLSGGSPAIFGICRCNSCPLLN